LKAIQEEKGIKVKTLEDEPVLSVHLGWIWRSFTELNYRRATGMNGPLPLTYADIEAYCNLRGIYTLYERQRLLRFLDLLDQEWMKDFYAKQEAENKTTAKSSSKSGVTTRGARRPPRKPVK
jgi:hypothetical protein